MFLNEKHCLKVKTSPQCLPLAHVCESFVGGTRCVFDLSKLQFRLVFYYPESFYTQNNTALFALFMLYTRKKSDFGWFHLETIVI